MTSFSAYGSIAKGRGYEPMESCLGCRKSFPKGTHPHQNGMLIPELWGDTDGPHKPASWRAYFGGMQ